MKWLANSLAFLATHSLAYQARTQIPAPPAAVCKCYPGESCWPSASEWSALNQTVGGRLVRVFPPGAVCYPSFNGILTANPARCAEVAKQ